MVKKFNRDKNLTLILLFGIILHIVEIWEVFVFVFLTRIAQILFGFVLLMLPFGRPDSGTFPILLAFCLPFGIIFILKGFGLKLD